LVTTCGEPPVPERARSVRTAGRRGFGRAEAVYAVCVSAAGSPMEGTSGAADLALLRGRAGKAALDPGCVRASDASRVRELLPFAGVGLVRWDRQVSLPHGSGNAGRFGMPEQPGNVGLSSRRRSALTTRGVRADRVGVVLSHGRSQERARGGVSGVASAPRDPWPVNLGWWLSKRWSGASATFPARDSATRTRRRAPSSGVASASPLDAIPGGLPSSPWNPRR